MSTTRDDGMGTTTLEALAEVEEIAPGPPPSASPQRPTMDDIPLPYQRPRFPWRLLVPVIATLIFCRGLRSACETEARMQWRHQEAFVPRDLFERYAGYVKSAVEGRDERIARLDAETRLLRIETAALNRRTARALKQAARFRAESARLRERWAGGARVP